MYDSIMVCEGFQNKPENNNNNNDNPCVYFGLYFVLSCFFWFCCCCCFLVRVDCICHQYAQTPQIDDDFDDDNNNIQWYLVFIHKVVGEENGRRRKEQEKKKNEFSWQKWNMDWTLINRLIASHSSKYYSYFILYTLLACVLFFFSFF